MDLSKLKNRSPYPFETLAVAISFSPHCEPVLMEAKYYAEVFNASLLLLHIGEKTIEKEQQLDDMLKRVGVNPNSRIIWMDGEPVDTILKLCKLNIVDLLIIGALEKENILKYYIGSIARSISRKAKCSVLLLSNAGVHAKKPKKIIVNGVENPKTIHTIKTALYLALYLQVKEVTIVNEIEIPGLTMAIADNSTAPEARELRKSLIEEEESHLHAVIDSCDIGDIQVTEKIIKGKPGYTIGKYAKDKKADLLVINSPDTHLNLFDRIFTHDIEFILAKLPCNVLIVHSRVSKS